MEFKKASRNVKFDDFINGADETANPTPKTKEVKETKEVIQITIKMPESLKNEIDKRIIRRSNTYSLKNFTKQFLLNDNQFLSDEAMIKIYQETTFYNIDISDYIKQKLGFIKIANFKKENQKEKIRQMLVAYSKEDKAKLDEKVENSHLSMNKYNLIKLTLGICTINLFNQDEMEQIIKESSKANISPREYISNKILQ